MPAHPESQASHRHEDDPAADRVIAFLRAEGAATLGHGNGRSLLDHLLETYEIARRWEQPSWLQLAALIHSVYGTEAYRQRLVPRDRRHEVSAVAGERAERLAHLFAVTPRGLLFAGTHRWARGPLTAPGDDSGATSADPPATRDELDALILLHLANLAEQARAHDGSPGTWLTDLRDQAEVVFDSDAVALPLFVATLAGCSPADEAACRSAYRDGLAQTDPAVRTERLALAAVACPVVAEPCVWLAYEARRRGERDTSRAWARTAERRLRGLGCAWDKRLRFDEWLTLIRLLDHGSGHGPTVTDPRALHDEVIRPAGDHEPGAPAAPFAPPAPFATTAPCAPAEPAAPAAPSAPAELAERADARPRPAAATSRFERYVRRLADASKPAGRLAYPDLDRRPWWEASAFAVATELGSHFVAIREEILALGSSRFAPESERIPRTGNWDVVFFYERGRRHDDACNACPATTRAIEGNGALRTAAGLIYVSRMRPGTHIEAHRGPTNLRVRCHLGISVPDGNCAIRVQDECRHWSEGTCLVFDDTFEHEAWNHAAEDRIVLIVDLWHPDLSDAEVHLLAGLHRYASGYAQRLDRYWAVNAAARREEPPA